MSTIVRPATVKVPLDVLGLGPGPTVAYAALMAFAEGPDGTKQAVSPSKAELGKMCAAEDRAVTRWIRALVDAGAVTVTARSGEDGGRLTNLYVLNWG